MKVIEMAFDMASTARKNPQSGVVDPLRKFDATGRRQGRAS